MTTRATCLTRALTTAMLLAAATANAQQPAPMPGPAPVAGGVCVVIDPARDTLSEQERAAAHSLLLQAFEAEKLPTDATGTACSETYSVSNIKLGNTINVTISGPRGQRTGRATALDDLPNVYSQMVRSLVTGAPMETGGGTTDRTNVTKEQSAPRRVQADNLKYVQLGYGMVGGPDVAYGPAFGFGYRKELDRIGIDISWAFLLANDKDRTDGFNWTLIKLLGLWYQDPIKDSTVYYGGGISYGWSAVWDDDVGHAYSGSGMQAHLIAGYEAFRSSTIRGFVQFDATLPLYKSEGLRDSDRRYTPQALLSLGFGWGKTTQVVRVINE